MQSNEGNKGVSTANLHGIEFINLNNIVIKVNPRTEKNQGFTPEKMKALRENIRTEGLKQNLEVWRPTDDGNYIQLIAGERRLRSILSLVQDNVLCYNRQTNKMEPASKVYETVPCKVTICKNEKDAMRAAVMENLLHEHLTDYELIIQCKILEDAGHSRSEQAKVFDKSEAWVSQSHTLLKSHPKILAALEDGTLGRTQALLLMRCKPEKIEAVLEKAIKYSKYQKEEEAKQVEDQLESVYEVIEELESEIEVARCTGNNKKLEDKQTELQEAESKATTLETKRKKIKNNKSTDSPKPSINDIQKAAEEEDAESGPSRHIPIKDVRAISDQLTSLLGSNDVLVSQDKKIEYNRREVRIVRDVLDCILRRNDMKNPLEALVTTEGDEIKVEN